MTKSVQSIALEYDGLRVYKVSDGNAWIRTIAENHIQALIYALNEDSGEYWGQECFEVEANFTVVMDSEGEDLTLCGGYDGDVTKTAAQWAHDHGEGILSVSEY